MIITSAGLAQLKAYKYQSGAYTPLDNFLNKYWWTPASEYVPSNIAPNLITLTGTYSNSILYLCSTKPRLRNIHEPY